MPVTVKEAGLSGLSEAGCGLFVTEPPRQLRLTLTALVLPSLKSLCTVKVAEFSVFVIVQVPVVIGTVLQPD